VQKLHGLTRYPRSGTSDCAFPTSTGSPQTNTHSVTVGAAGRLVFSPPRLNVTVGDTVIFEFLALNHTLTQSSLPNPCIHNPNGGIDTGFKQYNPSNTSGKFLVEYHVESSSPQWFFCSQTRNISHCNNGMVFALNPGTKFGAFLQAATAYPTATQASGYLYNSIYATAPPRASESGVAAGTDSFARPSSSTSSLDCHTTPLSTASSSLGASTTSSESSVTSEGYRDKRGGFRLMVLSLSFVMTTANLLQLNFRI
jgi:plastocyanin